MRILLFVLALLTSHACIGQDTIINGHKFHLKRNSYIFVYTTDTDTTYSIHTENWLCKYKRRSYYSNGKKKGKAVCRIFGVLRSKTWDQEGRIILRSRNSNFSSTSYIYTTREKTYDNSGHLISYEYTKKAVASFGGGLIRHRIVTYGDYRRNMKEFKKNWEAL